MLEALALLDYSLGSNTESEPSKVDPEESAEEDPIEEDPFEEDQQEADEPPSALAVPTSPARPALLVRPGQEVPFVAHTEYDLTGYGEKSSNPHGDPRSPLGTGMGMENDSLMGMGTGMRMRLINRDGDGK
ncbi:hypothetical protein Tco_0824936 [Tanacetum coccineum]